MQKIRDIKEVIIHVTTELIRENNGNVAKITSRKIAERAEIGLGLINYHFGSKENLINICVQRIINNVVMCFSPENKDYNERNGFADKERLADWAKQVYDFLFDNYAISSMSILGDMQNYQVKCNSVYTQKGFSMAIRNNITEENKRLLTFMLTSTMQVAFLSGSASKDVLGYDLTIKLERDRYIDKLVELLFVGVLGMTEG